MPRPEGNVTRCDIRVPNEIYDRIEALAIERGAKTHHRSHKPEVTGVILDLIKIGLANPHLSDTSSDKIADISDERLEGIIANVSDRVTDGLSDKLKTLSDLSDRVSDIEGIKDELMGKVAGLEEEISRLSQAYESRFNQDSGTDNDEEPIEPDPLPQAGINKDSLSPIFDADEEAVAVECEVISEDKHHCYEKQVNADRSPFPADGLSNTGLQHRYGFRESTARLWRDKGKHIVNLATAGETIRYSPDDKKWFLVEGDR